MVGEATTIVATLDEPLVAVNGMVTLTVKVVD
jgi:hypothetical protein